ncbi:cysteine hydrolase family protein [Deminuibacter soli]|uniref:Cysteine hydrolase n=1 Tax=Deminuibacter soli TaxID=2291815 RepID=A0A3E1NKA8_9BACT|nr:cysteine hydrolase family protein [Deminuibacter soli]RFM28311.1 cysteine hydrolase [Deminuibacter soli]
MALLSSPPPALILIDFQTGFDQVDYWGKERNNPGAENNAGALLQLWRQKGWPVFHVQHCSTNPASLLATTNAGNAFKTEVLPLPGEPVIKKQVNSAFIGTDLKEQLDNAGITQLVLTGLTTDHCVSTTARMAGNFGFDTYVVADATATFDKTAPAGEHFSAATIHSTALASLHGEFATVLNTADVLTGLRG